MNQKHVNCISLKINGFNCEGSKVLGGKSVARREVTFVLFSSVLESWKMDQYSEFNLIQILH